MKRLRSVTAAALLLVPAPGVSAQDPGEWSGQVSKAVALITGDGVKKDVRAGFELLQMAAVEDPLALRLLGDIYSTGKLVRKDELLAVQFYQKGAAAGEPDALSEIGMRRRLPRSCSARRPTQAPRPRCATSLAPSPGGPVELEVVAHDSSKPRALGLAARATVPTSTAFRPSWSSCLSEEITVYIETPR